MKKQVHYDIRDYSISEICVFIEDKDTGEDLKIKLKGIITNNKFRR